MTGGEDRNHDSEHRAEQPKVGSDVLDDSRQLRQRLKLDDRTKDNMLAAAVALARDEDAARVFQNHGIVAGSRARAKALADRVRSLMAASLEQAAPEHWLPAGCLLLRPVWIKQNAPNIIDWWADPLVVSADGQHATRTIHVRLPEELKTDAIVYDLRLRNGETEQNRHDKHRSREEACVRRLDSAAAAAYRARKSELQREQRLTQQTGDEDAVVRRILDNLIARLEREASREQLTWHCPGGCAPGSDCARAAFRMRCLPGDDDLRQLLHAQWRQQRKLVEFGKFRGESGHRFVRVDEQVRCYHQQEQELQQVPGYDASFGEAATIAEMKHDFLSTWSGKCAPLDHWSKDHRSPGASGGVLVPEYLGAQPFHPTAINPYTSMPPDQFGPDHRPVGPIACARRGCVGCCYCRDQPAPSPYVQTRRRGLIKCVQEWSKWQTIDELRADIECMILDAESQIERARLQPMPSYLLERTREPSSAGGGTVICIAGAVRRLISADELAEWSTRLNIHSIYLQVRFPARLRGPGPLHS